MPERYRNTAAYAGVAILAATSAAIVSYSVTRTSGGVRLGLLVGFGLFCGVLFAMLRRRSQKLEHRMERTQLMYEAGHRFSGTLVAEEIHDSLRRLIAEAMTFDGMIVSSYDPVSRTARCVYGWVNGRPFESSSLPPLTIDPQGGGMQTEVIRSGKGRLYSDVRERVRRPGSRYFDVDPRGRVRDLSIPDAPPPGSRCALMVPIKLEGSVIGIVQLMSDTPGAYKDEHLSVLESVVAPVAVALQNAELYARAKREIAERLRIEQALTLSEERLKEADRRKDDFLATLAHELRNPLAPIRNAVALLPNETAEKTQITWCREVIERQVSHMARLLDDLIDVSRISRGMLRLRTESVNLADVVHHAVEVSYPLLEAGRHHLTLSLAPEAIVLRADPTRLAQVFCNLLNNAARYSENGRPIHLSAVRDGDQAVVRVRDEGIGISPAMLPRIFEPYLQINRSLERSQGGLGIGLTLVQRIVEVHGGKVVAESDGLGLGSTFSVRLPAPAEVHLTVPTPPEAQGGTSLPAPKRRILVADDLEDSAASLALLLVREGHEVRTAHDGVEAVGVARSFLPDVVLLDIGMPNLNGYETARRILEEREEERPVMIALTGWGHDEHRQRTKEAGFDHHLVKPVEPATLTKLLATVGDR